MNLHGIVSPYIASINPSLDCSWQQSTGSETNPDGRRAARYAYAVTVRAQVQALTWKDLQQIDGINTGGVRCAMYITGKVDAVSRPEVKGGDLITTPNGQVWLVNQVLENWSMSANWTKVACTLQNGG